MSFVSDIVGGIMGAHAAGDAADVTSQAAKKAQDLIAKQQQHALDFQSGVWNEDKANQQPYLDVGSTSANHLRDFLNNPFIAPTLEQAKQNPGYQFALDQGVTALDKSAAARGDVFSGTQGTALQQYGQQLGEQNYSDVYNRAMGEYMNRFNTLMGGTQVGQTATGQYGQQGQAAASNTGYIDLTGADMQARQINNAAAARASGYLGTAKAWGTMAGNLEQDVVGGIGNLDRTGGSSPWEQAGNFFGF